MSSLTKVEEILAPLMSLYKGQIATDIQHYTSSEVEYPKGVVDWTVFYEPWQQISENERAVFFRITEHEKRIWEPVPLLPKFSVSQYIQTSLEDTLKGLAEVAAGYLPRGPLATINVTISISINFFDSMDAKQPVKCPSFGSNFSVNFSPSTKPLENTKASKAPEKDST
ncbi:MAG TPA: hypothetical protein VLG76_01955 [Rhabdochlamydiaceae bacterium]|nr:hypothetical protein [Rhabdochlamydiaceae bacterium]